MTRPSPSSTAEPHDIVVLEGVTKRFPGVVANDSVDLRIRSGEVHVLLGENGAGKSTLIGMLSGLQQPDEGRILVDGKPTPITSPRHALSLGIGTVFQHMMLVPTPDRRGEPAAWRSVVAAPQHRPARGARRRDHQIAQHHGPPACQGFRAVARRAAAGRDPARHGAQQPPAHPRRIDLHADAAGHRGTRRADAPPRRAGPGHRLHHPQAQGGRRLRRPHLGAEARPQGRRDHPAAAEIRSARRPPSPRSSR